MHHSVGVDNIDKVGEKDEKISVACHFVFFEI